VTEEPTITYALVDLRDQKLPFFIGESFPQGTSRSEQERVVLGQVRDMLRTFVLGSRVVRVRIGTEHNGLRAVSYTKKI
jgi:hypothetical protein